MRVLVTRAGQAAESLSARLLSLGYEPVLAPATRIVPRPWTADPDADLFLATSANAFAGLRGPAPNKPILVVGARTAAAARAAGFADAREAGGDVAGLIAALAARAPGQRIVYLAGADRKPDLEKALAAAGARATIVVAYAAEPAEALAPGAIERLRDGDVALHFSRRSAGIFLELADAGGFDPARLAHVAISADAARPLRARGLEPRVAGAPTEAGVLSTLTAAFPVAAGSPIRTDAARESGAMAGENDDKADEGARRARATPGATEKAVDATMGAEAATALGEDRPPAGDPPNPPPQPPPRRVPSAASAAIGGVAGALLATGAHWLLPSDAQLSPDVTARLTAAENVARAAASREALAALERRLATLDAALAPLKSASESATARAEAAETAARTANAAVATMKADLARAIAAGGAPGAPAFDPGPLTERVGALETRIVALEKAASAPKIEARAAREVDAAPAGGGAAMLMMAAEQTRQALERGEPFERQFAALAALGADPARLKALEPFAAGGAPTAEALARRFAPLAGRLAAEEPAGRKTGIGDRIAGWAARLARVRPVGDAPGDDPPAIVARIEAALARGAIGEAVALQEKLPGPARALSQAWANEARARAAADAAARAIGEDALAGLAKPKT